MSEQHSPSLSSLDPARLPPVSELQSTRFQVEKELEFLSSSHGQLINAKTKCLDNMTMIGHLKDLSAEQEMLAPITDSMFIPVKLVDGHKVMTDIGTGFVVERNAEDAQKYFERKVETIVENVKKVEMALLNKQNAMKFLNEALRIKLEAEREK